MTTGNAAAKAAAEAKFPHRVDVPLPGIGWGRMRKMLDWCRENVAAGATDMHHHSGGRRGEQPTDYARFYFANERDAKAFRLHWMTE